MFEFLRDYFIYFWNLLFRRNLPTSGTLTNTEADKKPVEAKVEKERIAEPVPGKAESTNKESALKDSTPVKTPTPPPPPPPPAPSNPTVVSKKSATDSPSSPVQTRPIQIQQPISHPQPRFPEPDERILKSDSKSDTGSEGGNSDSFIKVEKLQLSEQPEVKREAPPTEELREKSYKNEDEEIESIVEDILNYEEELPDEENENFVDDDLQKKIREHLRALQEQESLFQKQQPQPQTPKSAQHITPQTQQNKQAVQQLKYESDEEMAANEETSQALVTLAEDLPQLPDLKGKTGGATVKASEEDSKVTETHKTVTKNEGDKKLEQQTHKLQKQDSAKTAEASIKTTNEGGVRRTVATTQVTFSSSFEEEETTQQKITSAPIKSIVKK